MAIPNEYLTSNPLVRDALAAIPIAQGTKTGDFVAPDFPADAETVDMVFQAQHSLNLDDLRAPDAEAKEIRFETAGIGTVSVVERAFKTKIDSRKLDEAGRRGVDLLAQRGVLMRDDIFDAKEYRIAQMVMTAASYPASHKDQTGINWRTADLVALRDTWNDQVIADGNQPLAYAILGRLAWRGIRKNPQFREFAAGSALYAASAKNMTLQALADFLDLTEIRVGNYSRRLASGGAAAAVTQFWDPNSALFFARQATLSNRTLAQTMVVPYGANQRSNGETVDVRTEPLPGTERRTEVGVYHRYRTFLRNANLGFLVTDTVST